MRAKLVFATMVRCLGVLLVMGVLIPLSACSPTQIAPPVTPQGGEAGADSPTQTAPPVIPQGGETGAGFIETVPPVTATVDSAMIAPQEIEKPSRGNPKLGSSLNQLLEAYHQGGLAEAQAFAAMHMMVLDDNRVQVEVLTSTEAMSDLIAAIEAVGGEYQSHYEAVVQVLVPIDALESLAQRPDVQAIREPQRAVVP